MIQSPVSLPEAFCIENVDVWNSDGVRKSQDVFVKAGLVEAIVPHGSRPQASFRIDGEGKVLMPSGLDAQAHLRVPGQAEKETPETGLRAALRGGYAALLTMPNTKPVIDSVAALEEGRAQLARATQSYGIDVLWSAAITRGQNGEELADLESLAKAGIVAFTDDGKGVERDDLMAKAFAKLEELGQPLLQHAEFPNHGGVLAPGPTQAQLGIKPYFDDVEWKMVERDIEVLESHPRARYHVLHVSSAKTVEIVSKARSAGLKVSAEVSPHHLFFTSDDIPKGRSEFKMNPPLRSQKDREVLIAALAKGELDFVATDHAPHEITKKGEDFTGAAFGTTGLETCLRTLLHFYKQGKLSAERVVASFATKPAEFLGVGERYGRIETGRRLFASLVDVDAPAVEITESDLESLSKNNCFIGSRLPGKILKVFQPDKAWAVN